MTMPGGANPPAVLFNLALKRALAPPVLEQVSESGPPHCKIFVCSGSWLDGKYQSQGEGRSKKEAKNMAAKKLIEQVDLDSLPDASAQRNPERMPMDPMNRMNKAAKRRAKQMMTNPGNMFTNETTLFVQGDDEETAAAKKPKEDEDEDGGAAVSIRPLFNKMQHASMRGGGRNARGGMMAGPHGFMDMAWNHDQMMDPWRGPFPMGRGRGGGRMRGRGRRGMRGMGPMMMGGMMGGMMGQQGFEEFGAPYRPVYSHEDKHVMEKHSRICPMNGELDIIVELTNYTEHSLKMASDILMQEVGGARELMGVARVGNLSKSLLLAGDLSVEMVVMCRTKPTLQLLGAVQDVLESRINVLSEKSGYEYVVSALPGQAALAVTLKEGEPPHYRVLVTLTSSMYRQEDDVKKEEEVEEGEEEEEKVVKEEKEGKVVKVEKEGEEGEEGKLMAAIVKQGEKDTSKVLPSRKCLLGLAELRHSKWFEAMAAPIEGAKESIRIFRTLAKTSTPLERLGSWALELVVERAMGKTGRSLAPSDAILAVLQILGSDVILGGVIPDPCERNQDDVLSHLSSENREELYNWALEATKKITDKKTHEFLEMDRMSDEQLGDQKEEEEKKEEDLEKTEIISSEVNEEGKRELNKEEMEEMALVKIEAKEAEKKMMELAMARIAAKEKEGETVL